MKMCHQEMQNEDVSSGLKNINRIYIYIYIHIQIMCRWWQNKQKHFKMYLILVLAVSHISYYVIKPLNGLFLHNYFFF